MTLIDPYIIDFQRIGDAANGYIAVSEYSLLPFEPKRTYWTWLTPENVSRGGHSHFELEQVLIAVSGTITVNLELSNGDKSEFILNDPSKGLYIPTMTWRTMNYTNGAVQLCMASRSYMESDYIRDYNKFLALCQSD